MWFIAVSLLAMVLVFIALLQVVVRIPGLLPPSLIVMAAVMAGMVLGLAIGGMVCVAGVFGP